MCGIVGIVGAAPVAGEIVESLRRLEYRGYDSAGVATLEQGHLTRVRAEGKLKNLAAKLAASPLQGTVGIGHTRWATHGRPTENNAHPHATDKVAVVHNGIIENFRELREELGIEVAAPRMIWREDAGPLRLRFYACEYPPLQRPRALVSPQFRWVRREDLLRYEFPPADDRLVAALAEDRVGRRKRRRRRRRRVPSRP
jgi:hypothetical protein